MFQKLIKRASLLSVFVLSFVLVVQISPADAAAGGDGNDYTYTVADTGPTAQSFAQYLDKNSKKFEKVSKKVKNSEAVVPAYTSSPTGFSPAKIKTAYNFPTGNTAGKGKT